MKYVQKVVFEERAAATLYSPTTTLVCDEGQSRILTKRVEDIEDAPLEIKGNSLNNLIVEEKPVLELISGVPGWGPDDCIVTYKLYVSEKMSSCKILCEDIGEELNIDLINGQFSKHFDLGKTDIVVTLIPKWVVNGVEYTGEPIQGRSVSCFPVGTKVVVSLNGSERNIEDIAVGDNIVCYDNGEFVMHTVKTKFSPMSEHYITITFTDGTELKSSWGHPLLSTTGWKSYVPHVMFDGVNTSMLQSGDEIIGFGSNKVVDTITYTEEPIQMYSMEVDNYNNFLVNKIVVADTKQKQGGVVKGTPVSMGETSKSIEDVTTSDMVLARNLTTGEDDLVEVKEVVNCGIKTAIKLTLENGSETETLVLSPNQLIYTENGWKSANENIVDGKVTDPLQIGDRVITIDDEVFYTVTNIETNADANLYELDTDDEYDNFFISWGGHSHPQPVLMHNY